VTHTHRERWSEICHTRRHGALSACDMPRTLYLNCHPPRRYSPPEDAMRALKRPMMSHSHTLHSVWQRALSLRMEHAWVRRARNATNGVVRARWSWPCRQKARTARRLNIQRKAAPTHPSLTATQSDTHIVTNEAARMREGRRCRGVLGCGAGKAQTGDCTHAVERWVAWPPCYNSEQFRLLL